MSLLVSDVLVQCGKCNHIESETGFSPNGSTQDALKCPNCGAGEDSVSEVKEGRIIHSSECGGATGDKGEQYCLFFRDHRNPLNSEWAWFETMDQAVQALARVTS